MHATSAFQPRVTRLNRLCRLSSPLPPMNPPQLLLDRDALYYPYIHIRDVNWLKATLLCFPQVRRIVPHEFRLNDSPEIAEFRGLTGARGQPLLLEEPAISPAVVAAQSELLRRIKLMNPEEWKKFSKEAVAKEFNGKTEKFQIHRGKMDPLLQFLEAEKLAWPAREIGATLPGHEWYAVHPSLGEGIMSVLSIAIAKESGLDIVTSDGRVHNALRTLDSEIVFRELTGGNMRGDGMSMDESVTDKTDYLAQVFMLTTFDFSKLSPKQIGELVKDGKDLLRFKSRISGLASSIPEIEDELKRKRRFEDAAREIGEEWKSYKKSLPGFALDAIVSIADYKTPELVVSAVAGVTVKAMVSLGGGLIVGLGALAGYKTFQAYKEKASSPYAYLSRIEKAGAVLAAASSHREPFEVEVVSAF